MRYLFALAAIGLSVATSAVAQTTTNCTADIYGKPQYGVTCKTQPDQPQVQLDTSSFLKGMAEAFDNMRKIQENADSRNQAARPYGLGIQGQALTDSPTADHPGGFMVTAVADGSPAQLAGIRPMMTITYINGQRVTNGPEASAAVRSGYGKTFPVKFLNEYGEQTASITLGVDGSWYQ